MDRITKRADFDRVWKKRSLVVMFTASWCGPCKMIKPMMERVSKEKAYKDYTFVMLDIDQGDNMTISDQMRVDAVPTIFYVRSGVIERTTDGVISEETFRKNLALLS